MPHQVIIALETFSTRRTFELFRVHVHVSAVHLFMFEHKGAFLTDVSLVVTPHHLGHRHRGLRLYRLRYRLGVDLYVLLRLWYRCLDGVVGLDGEVEDWPPETLISAELTSPASCKTDIYSI